MLFGDRLRNLREEKDITQQKLGEIIGVSARVVGYYENNDRFPKEELILKNIASYFKVTTDFLLGRTDTKTAQVIENKIQDPELIKLLERADKELSSKEKRTVMKIIKSVLDDEDE